MKFLIPGGGGSITERKKKKKNKSRNKSKIKEHLVSGIFLAPSFLGVMVFMVVPFMVIIYYSLVDGPVDGNFAGLDNFKMLFSNDAFLQAAKNSILFSAIAVPMAVVLSLMLAVLLDANIPWQSQFRTFFLCPMMVPVASVVLIWQVIFNAHGVMNNLLEIFGFQGTDWLKSDYSMLVVISMFLWKNLGYNMILFMAALGSVPKDIIEVAQLEAAGKFTIFFRIKLRYINSTVLFVIILSLMNSFKVFREVYLLSGAYPYESLYMLQHFMNNTFESLDYQKLSSAAIVMCVFMIVVIGILFFIESKAGEDFEG